MIAFCFCVVVAVVSAVSAFTIFDESLYENAHYPHPPPQPSAPISFLLPPPTPLQQFDICETYWTDCAKTDKSMKRPKCQMIVLTIPVTKGLNDSAHYSCDKRPK